MLKLKKPILTRKFPLPLLSIALITLIVIPVAVALSRPGQPAAAATSGPTDGYGIYESCVPYGKTNECLTRLDTIAAGGFKVVVNYNQMWGNFEGQLAYLDRAQADGIKVILAINDSAFWNGTSLKTYYPEMGAGCNCTNNTGFITSVVNLVKNHPALWGYYIADEVNPAQHAKVKTYTDLLKSLDPNHPRLIVLGTDDSNVNAGMDTLADTADVLGQDYYPIGVENVLSQSVAGTVNLAQTTQAVANKNGKQSAFVLQAHSLGQYDVYRSWCSPFPSCMPYPSADQMRTMRDNIVQNAHPRLILWYSYFDLLQSDNYAKHWSDVTTVIKSSPPTSQTPSAQPTYTKTQAGTPTATPTTTPMPTGTMQWIYQDALLSGWEDWSWNSTTNLADQTQGTSTIAWTPKAQHAGLYLHTWDGISTNNYTMMTFAIKASAYNQNLAVGLVGTNEKVATYLPLSQFGKNPDPTGYTVYNIPLAKLNATDKTIRGFELMNSAPGAQPPLYVDTIGLK